MALLHQAVCAECDRKEPAVEKPATASTSSTSSGGYIAVTPPSYEHPKEWKELDGLHFCSYKCVATYATRWSTAPAMPFQAAR